jgi:hypothetical protein
MDQGVDTGGGPSTDVGVGASITMDGDPGMGMAAKARRREVTAGRPLWSARWRAVLLAQALAPL